MKFFGVIVVVIAACILTAGVQGWGGWNRITSEVHRAADNVGREVNRAVNQVTQGAKHVGSQIEEVYHEAVKEVEKVPKEVETWFVPDAPDDSQPTEASVTRVRRRGCRPLINDTVDFSCVNLQGRHPDCAYPQAVGTVATITCKAGYKLSEFPGFTEINCTEEFKWNKQYFTCIPDCGKRNVKVDVRSLSGSDTTPELPWNIDIFDNQHQHLCSGSLITTTLVLTAASCFWDLERNERTNTTGMHLLAGSSTRSWPTFGQWEQRSDIVDVYLTERFAGRDRLLADDLAIVRASQAFTLSKGVATVCLDWINAPGHTALEEGDIGWVATWPDLESATASETNTARSLSFVTFETCADDFDTEYLTHDKMCASTGGSDVNVCGSDAGTGFSFPLQTIQGTRYFLRGVLSSPINATASSCGHQQKALFTQFSAHLKWARPIVFHTAG